jgi:hypothetical protein
MPLIEAFQYGPVEPVYNQNFDFSINLFETGSGIKSVICRYDVGYGWTDSPMQLTNIDEQIYSGQLINTLYQYGSVLKFYFVITDNWGNSIQYSNNNPAGFISLRIADKTIPIISNLAADSSTVRAEKPFNITANLFDEASGLKNISLFYSNNQGKSWENKSMTLMNNTLTNYTVTIGGFPEQSIVIFYVRAIDKDNNVAFSNNTGPFPMVLISTQLDKLEYMYIGMGIAGSAALVIIVVTIIIRHKRVARLSAR